MTSSTRYRSMYAVTFMFVNLVRPRRVEFPPANAGAVDRNARFRA